jgi:ATP phosphoribosyltransferase regulatory subunit
VPAIRAPWSDDPALAQAVAALRAQGHVVIQSLPGEPQQYDEFRVGQELVSADGGWVLRTVAA